MKLLLFVVLFSASAMAGELTPVEQCIHDIPHEKFLQLGEAACGLCQAASCDEFWFAAKTLAKKSGAGGGYLRDHPGFQWP